MTDDQKKKQCIRCLLREMDQDAYIKNIHEYIQNIDEDIKTEEKLYERRLDICKQCDYLHEGMCRACGCFAELRAAVSSNCCSYDKW